MLLQFIRLKSTRQEYRVIFIVLVILVGLAVLGFAAAHYMDTNGHYVTGMSNQVVWGIPHVFALSLILAASGALNVASLWSVFAIPIYQPVARLSALMAIALLLGGLLILVLDLGRPERLIIAMTHYNFKSVFAWNIFLYIGFIAVAVGYLWAQFEHRLHGYIRPLGVLIFLWRFIMTSGSGAIFGFLVARPGYDAAIMVPLFIALSLSLGTAVFILIAGALSKLFENYSDASVLTPLAQLLRWFVCVVLFLTIVSHLTNLYSAEHYPVELFILVQGGVYTGLFWLQLCLGGVVPLVLLFTPQLRTYAPMRSLMYAAALVVIGGFSQLYVIIIGGQVLPTVMFPGKTVTSSFYDGVIAIYSPSLPEILLGFGGVSVALLILLLVMRVLPFASVGRSMVGMKNNMPHDQKNNIPHAQKHDMPHNMTKATPSVNAE